MAAKPPKPPGNFLKLLLNHNNKQQHYNEEQDTEGNSDNSNTSATDNCHTITKATTTTSAAKQTLCNCSNISIMHLFHEMKQEFPTIPDTIVAQCVNENCHKRENCIQMLRNELELNPIPVQSYPAKVLHPPPATSTNAINNNNNTTTINIPTSTQKPPLQQKPQILQQKPPLKPLKPIRTAPLQPPQQQQTVLTPTHNNTNRNSTLKAATTSNKNISHASGGGGGENNVSGGVELNDMPTKNSPLYKQPQQLLTANSLNEVNNNENVVVCGGGGGAGECTERNLPRQRPTTLNLNTKQQKQQQQQRQLLNIQLQQHLQERNKQYQQQSHVTKPIRKAPLPPIAPKPLQFQLNANNNSFNNDTLSSTHTSPLSESEISVSVSLSTPSPTSSSSSSANKTHHQQFQTKSPIRHRSVITLQPEPPYTRDFASTPITNTSTTSSPTSSLAGSQKSFTSVNLTLRPPVTPTVGGGAGSSNTALQPSTIDITAGPGFSGASGGAGGKSLHYSSTSYDARLGYQQNFQITVTDEGGLFSASRIRPQQQQRSINQVNISENQYDGNTGVDSATNNNYVNSLYAEQQQNVQQHQQLYLLQQQQQQFHNSNVVALQQNIQNSINSPQGVGGGGVGGIGGNMCLPPQQAVDGYTAEILQRQKKRRDKLAAALRENKKRLSQVEQEINLITGPITAGLSERLDTEIHKLRTDCQAMLRSSNPFTQQSQEQQQQPQQFAINQTQQQQQPQPFPRQRPSRPPPRPPPPRQTSLDFIQHHSQSSTPHTPPPPTASLPNLNILNTHSPILAQRHHQQLQQQHSNSISPSFYQHHTSSGLTNEDIYADTDEEDYQDDDNEYDEVVEPWECNMCTFRNHPQLNICEACDNVRILPGMLPNLSTAISNSSAAIAATAAVASPAAVGLLTAVPSSTSLNSNGAGTVVNNATTSNNVNALSPSNGNLEHDTNLAQQQLQHFALHT